MFLLLGKFSKINIKRKRSTFVLQHKHKKRRKRNYLAKNKLFSKTSLTNVLKYQITHTAIKFQHFSLQY